MSGYLTIGTGFEVSLAEAQATGVFEWMQRCLAFAPLLALAPALFFILRYPITEEIAGANRRLLDARDNCTPAA